MQTIFLDESGYTGEHLLDTDQPIFALASHHISERSCEELKRRFFGRVQARELKYSQLRRVHDNNGWSSSSFASFLSIASLPSKSMLFRSGTRSRNFG